MVIKEKKQLNKHQSVCIHTVGIVIKKRENNLIRLRLEKIQSTKTEDSILTRCRITA